MTARLEQLLAAATPGPWAVRHGTDEPHLGLWANGFCIADDAFHYGTTADYELAAKAPDMARLLIDMGEWMGSLMAEVHLAETPRALLARLDALGKDTA